MSVESIVFVFENIFPNTFNYDAKYDELTFNVKEFDIKQYDINLRNIWYKLYPSLLNKYHKLSKVYNNVNLMNDIESDSLLSYIPLKFISSNTLLKDREFHKLLEDDYNFQKLTTRADRKHFNFNYAVKYDIPQLSLKGWNFNHYLNNNMLKLKDIPSFAFDIIDYKYLIQYMNKYKEIRALERFTNSEHSELIIPEGADIPQLDNWMLIRLGNDIINNLTHSAKLTSMKLLKLSSFSLYRQFDLSNASIVSFIINSMTDEYKRCENPKDNSIIDAESNKQSLKLVAKSLLSDETFNLKISDQLTRDN